MFYLLMFVCLIIVFVLCYFRPAPTYETASIRKYYHGRTETVRTCTTEVINWCKAMLDNTVTVSPLICTMLHYQLYRQLYLKLAWGSAKVAIVASNGYVPLTLLIQ